MRILFILIFILFGYPFSFAQQPAYFILGEKEFEGVQIYDVIQDNDLNYWFATDQGFYKYDNYNFEPVACEDMKGQAAFSFVKSSDGIIFCYNLNNQIIKIEKGVCSIFYEIKADETANDIFLTITSENKLMVLANTILVFSLNGEKENVEPARSSHYSFPFQLSNGKTISHLSDRDSMIVFDGSDFEIIHLKTDTKKINGILVFFRIKNVIYAISSKEKKLFVFDEKNYSLVEKSDFKTIFDEEFLRFYVENGFLWIAGTVSGVHQFQADENYSISEKFYKDFLISDVFTDSEGNILFSTFNHGVIVVPDIRFKDVIEISKSSDIVSIHLDHKMGLLAGTLTGKLMAYSENGAKTITDSGSRPLQAVFSWKNFPFLVFDDGLIKILNKETGASKTIDYSSLKDAALLDDNTVYLALNKGVAKLSLVPKIQFEILPDLKSRSYNLELEKSENRIYVSTSDGLKTFYPNGKIESISFKGELVFSNDIYNFRDSIFIATKKQGILVFKKGKLVKQIIPKFNSQRSEIVKIVVNKEKIYALTNFGFFIIDRKDQSYLQLNKVHGFSTNKIFDFEVGDGFIWMNHSKGVQKLDLNLLVMTAQKPVVNLMDISINDKLIDRKKESNVFGNDMRNFRFVFSSPTLRYKENTRYHYKLEGYSDEWKISDYSENAVVFNALAPGNYTFMVKAENQGVFSEPASYSFTISAPVYLRWWFILIVSILVIVIITIVFRSKLISQKKKAKQLNELNSSKLTAIQSQMNPHFIFNSLNSIQDLVLKGDIDNSYTFITKFSDLVRRTLSYSEKDFIEFEQEIKLIELYLTLEKLRFKEELNYIIDTGGIEDIMIPPMLIQPFIENALLHGLLHKEGMKNLKIKFRLEELLICEIIDNGIGREKSAEIKKRQRADHESFSSNAIKRRFEILSDHFNSELGFEYENLMEDGVVSGTKVIIRIPVKHKF